MPPRPRLGPLQVALLAAALGCAAGAVPLGAGFPWAAVILEELPAGVLVVAVFAAFVAVMVTRVCVVSHWLVLVVAAPVGGAIVCVASASFLFAAMMVAQPEPAWGEVGVFPLIAIYGGVVGASVGGVFALALAPLVAFARSHLRRRTLDGGPRAAIGAAVWLGAVSAASFGRGPETDMWRIGLVTSVAGMLAAVTLGAWGIAALVRQRRFFASVARSEIPHLRLRPLAPHDDVRGVPAYASRPSDPAATAILERRASPSPATYRARASEWEPLALVRAAS